MGHQHIQNSNRKRIGFPALTLSSSTSTVDTSISNRNETYSGLQRQFSIAFAGFTTELHNINFSLSIQFQLFYSPSYQYQYQYQLIWRGLININMLSIIGKFPYQFQYQYQLIYSLINIDINISVHVWNLCTDFFSKGVVVFYVRLKKKLLSRAWKSRLPSRKTSLLRHCSVVLK